MSKKKSSPRIPPLPESQALHLPPCGVDSHAHLDSKEFRQDLPQVLALARQCGLSHMGNVFLGPEEYDAGRSLFDAHPEVFFILGLHPCDGQRCTPEALTRMEAIFRSDARIKALGEIGLDFYWDDCPPDVQHAAFRAQLALTKKLDLPVVIHSREATEATVKVLESEGFKDYPLLWHCFGGTAAEAARIIANGWHVSVPGPVSYPANEPLREAVRNVPLERLLLETDCPYLAPVEWRGKRNEPAFTVFTAKHMAEARGMAPAELWQACGHNARRFFKLEDNHG